MSRSLIFALALSSGIIAGTPTLAAPTGPQTAKVSYADLDLTSAAGNRALERRIKRALRRVCDFNAHERQQAIKRDAARCMTETREQIVLPQVAASYVASR